MLYQYRYLIFDAIFPEGGGRELLLDEGLGPVENGAGRRNLAPAGVVQRQVAVDHVFCS